MCYADIDIVRRNTVSVTFKLLDTALMLGLKINEKKTKYMCTGKSVERLKQYISVGDFEVVDNFKYLGCIVNNNSSLTDEVKQRLQVLNKAYHSFYDVMRSKIVTRATKIILYKSLSRPVLTCAAETRAVRKADERKRQL